MLKLIDLHNSIDNKMKMVISNFYMNSFGVDSHLQIDDCSNLKTNLTIYLNVWLLILQYDNI